MASVRDYPQPGDRTQTPSTYSELSASISTASGESSDQRKRNSASRNAVAPGTESGYTNNSSAKESEDRANENHILSSNKNYFKERGVMTSDGMAQATEYVKSMEERIAYLEGRLSSLDAENDKAGEKRNTKSEKGSEEADTEDKEGEEGALISKLNRLSWAGWLRLKTSEKPAEVEKGRKVPGKRTEKKKKYVLDVVTPKIDVGAYQHMQSGDFRIRPDPIRVRINSSAVIDILTHITGLLLPSPCIMLQPFKVLIDFEESIRGRLCILLAESREIARSSESGDPNVANPVVLEQNGRNIVTKIASSEEKLTAKEKVEQLECLVNFMDEDLESAFKISRAIKTGTLRKIAFSDLWYLFSPGEVVFQEDSKGVQPSQFYQVLNVTGGRPKLNNPSPEPWEERKDIYEGTVSPFTLDCYYLDFDGKKYQPVQKSFQIPNYPGEYCITDLPLFPFKFRPEEGRSKLYGDFVARGRTFQVLAAEPASHREYRGLTLDEPKEEVDSRVIVDFAKATLLADDAEHRGQVESRTQGREGQKETKDGGRTFGLVPFTYTNTREVQEIDLANGKDTIFSDKNDPTLFNDTSYDIERAESLLEKLPLLMSRSTEMQPQTLNDEDLVLLPGHVYAFVLRSRKYCRCDITLLEDVIVNKQSFDSLVLPSRHKKLMKALVNTHARGTRPIDTSRKTKAQDHSQDLVRGKGKGLIILLHGVPGVGKTSTAETIAEATERPLFPVTCGDIGETASEVEGKLEQIFSLAHRWGCVLLLDEADVFLAKRDKADMKRNAMVSVFLRILEYYSGILFLTTNRVGTFDEAFKSRIHVSLYYPPLDWKSTKEIWKVNLDRAKIRVNYDHEDILKYAKKYFINHERSQWNGRQIFNAFQTAIALAGYDAANKTKSGTGEDSLPVLTKYHFKQVARTSEKFEDYMSEVFRGDDDARINEMDQTRADDYGRSIAAKSQMKSGMRKKESSVLSSDSELSSDSSSEEGSGSDDNSNSELEQRTKRNTKRNGKDARSGKDKKSKRGKNIDEDVENRSTKPKKSKKKVLRESDEEDESESGSG